MQAQLRNDALGRQLADLQSGKSRASTAAAALSRQQEEAEAQINALGRVKHQLQSANEELKRTVDEETREKQSAQSQMRNYQHECEVSRSPL